MNTSVSVVEIKHDCRGSGWQENSKSRRRKPAELHVTSNKGSRFTSFTPETADAPCLIHMPRIKHSSVEEGFYFRPP